MFTSSRGRDAKTCKAYRYNIEWKRSCTKSKVSFSLYLSVFYASHCFFLYSFMLIRLFLFLCSSISFRVFYPPLSLPPPPLLFTLFPSSTCEPEPSTKCQPETSTRKEEIIFSQTKT